MHHNIGERIEKVKLCIRVCFFTYDMLKPGVDFICYQLIEVHDEIRHQT
jgi:hypothetical protein